jgi:excinuclease UvrABC helicase subunit UvrB
MTEDQMNQLADIIVSKILERQAEYDAEFLKAMEAQAGYRIEYFSTDTSSTGLTKEEKINLLEEQLKHALEIEDYEKAAKLVTEISELKLK